MCKQCSKPLVDRTGFVLKDNGKYCVDCVCGRCEKILQVHSENSSKHRSPLVTQTTGKKYCDDCVCAGCSTPLVHSKGHHQHGSSHYCGKCVCARCTTPIAGQQNTQKTSTGYAKYLLSLFVSYLFARTYCANCCCNNCQTPLVNVGYITTDNHRICFKCVCARCEKVFSNDGKFPLFC